MLLEIPLTRGKRGAMYSKSKFLETLKCNYTFFLFKVDLQGPSIGVIVAHKHFAPLSQLEKYGVSVRVHFGQTQVGGNDGLFVQADGRSKAALDGRAVDKMQKSSSVSVRNLLSLLENVICPKGNR